MNVLIKQFSAILIALILVAPFSLRAESEKDKEKEYKKIELQLIKTYLSELENKVDLEQEQIIKVYNDKDQLEYKGDPECKKGRKIVRDSDLLVETEEAKIYLAEG